ncbi:GTP 3',8-cyclase [subsurface metagenome]
MEKIVKGLPTYLEKIEGINLKNREIIFLMLSVPPICNYRCKKCFNSVGSRQIKNSLTLDEIFRIIKEAKALGIRGVTILGEGEPLVYKNIKQIVEWVDKLRMILTISTNGRMLTKDMANFLYKHNVVVGIGLDTLNEKEYVSYCGGNANLKEVLKNIAYIRKLYSKKIYKKNGYKIYQLLLHMTVTSKNYNQMKKLEGFCKDDIYFDCQSLSEVGDAKKNISFFKKGKNDYDYKTFKKFGHLIKPPMVLLKMENEKNICCLFYYGIFVGYNGDVVLDASIKESLKYIGNIKDYPLKRLVEKRNKLRDFYLKNYNLLGYCPIREQSTLKKFIKDLKESKYKP